MATSIPLGKLTEITTGKRDANFGGTSGKYPFFTCARKHIFADSYSFDQEALLVAGNGDVGHVQYYNGKFEAYQRTYVLGGFSKEVRPKYLMHAIKHGLKNHLSSRTHGSTMPYIRLGDLQGFEVIVPSLDSQDSSLLSLERTEQTIRLRENSIIELDNYLRSLFIEMFGNPVTNPKKWPTAELNAISEICRGRFSPRPRNDPAYYGGPYPFIQTGDIANSNYRLTNWHQTLNEKGIKVSKEFKSGTIVVAIVGATIGATSILEIDSYAPDSVIGIVVDPKKSSNVYIEFLLRFFRPVFVAQAPATARANINLDTLKPLVTQLPPLELQMKFESHVKAALDLQKKMQSSYSDCNSLLQSLLNETFGVSH